MTLSEVAWDAEGLVVVIAQERHSGEIRMVAYANREALERTRSTGQAHFYSRSRKELWRKGETSGNLMAVSEVRVDCDADAVVYVVDAQGPSCHTGEENCFFYTIDEQRQINRSDERLLPTLFRLEQRLTQRAQQSSEESYTRSLLDRGADAIAAKISEEAGELGNALRSESDGRVQAESADLIYHTLVGLLSRGVSLKAVCEELAERFEQSGHAEKAARVSKS